MGNMIRSVRTPTEEVIQELTNLLKHQRIQECKLLRSTISMTLTQMVYKACVDETSSVFDLPTSVYGEFCSENSRSIKKDLIPFLQSSLYELKGELQQENPSPRTMNKLISLINALGNLGIEEASKICGCVQTYQISSKKPHKVQTSYPCYDPEQC